MKRSFKNIFCAVLVIMAILITQFCPVQAETIEELSYDFSLLMELGILRGDGTGDYRFDDNVSRAEFTALILRMMGYTQFAEGSVFETGFSDVPSDHWAAPVIKTAVDLGLINGIGDGTFCPDRPISKNEAVKITVCALGYGVLALNRGEYPWGYLSMASQLRILKGIGEGEFTRRDACILIDNSLTVDIMDGMGTVISGNNMLSHSFDIDVMRGIVTGTPEICPTGYIVKGHIEISGITYKMLYRAAEELFGCSVEFYVKDRNGTKEICYIKILDEQDRIKVSSEDILSSTTLNSFEYFEGNNTRTKSLTDNLIIYYNGRKVNSANMNDSLLKPHKGNVILFDAQADRIYDFAAVTEWETVVVNYVNDDMIYDLYNNHIDVGNADVAIIKNNVEIDAADLEEGDVLLVARSLDGKCVNIIAHSVMYEGYVSSTTMNGSQKMCTITCDDGTQVTFGIARSFANAMSAGLASNVLEPGNQKIKVYVNAFDEIANTVVLKEDGNLDRYGYVANIRLDASLADNLYLKILTEDNLFTEYTISANRNIPVGRYSGTQYSEFSANASDIYGYFGGDNMTAQLVTYRANENNEITELNFPDIRTNTSTFSCDVARTYMDYNQSVLSHKYFLNEDTVVFSIPNDNIYQEIMTAGGYKSFFTNNRAYHCTLYDVDNGRVGAVIIHGATKIKYDSPDDGAEKIIGYDSSPIMFINSSNQTMGENGEIVYNLKGYKNGEEITLPVDDSVRGDAALSSQLRAGNVIQYETDITDDSRSGNYDDTEKLIVFKNIFDFTESNGNGIRWNHDIIVETIPDILTLWGVVKDEDPAFITVTVQENGVGTDYTMSLFNNVNILKYDKIDKRFVPAKAEEIEAGQSVYMCKRGTLQDIVIYE